jgi:[ribosomal protein S18]-alanine N-acetyltransferase
MCDDASRMITQYDIALAVASDALLIAQLSRDTIEQGLSWSWTPRRVMRSVKDPATNVIVARQTNRLLGFAIMKYADDEAHLLLLAVQPGRRRKGVGSALLAWLEMTTAIAGIAAVSLEARASNAAARAFYAAHGFREIERRDGYYEGVEDAVRMRKQFHT